MPKPIIAMATKLPKYLQFNHFNQFKKCYLQYLLVLEALQGAILLHRPLSNDHWLGWFGHMKSCIIEKSHCRLIVCHISISESLKLQPTLTHKACARATELATIIGPLPPFNWIQRTCGLSLAPFQTNVWMHSKQNIIKNWWHRCRMPERFQANCTFFCETVRRAEH